MNPEDQNGSEPPAGSESAASAGTDSSGLAGAERSLLPAGGEALRRDASASAEDEGSGDEGSDDAGSGAEGSDDEGSGDESSEAAGSGDEGSDEDGSDEEGSDEDGSDEDGSDEEGSDEEGSDEDGSDEDGSDEDGSDEDGSDEDGSDEEGSGDDGAGDEGEGGEAASEADASDDASALGGSGKGAVASDGDMGTGVRELTAEEEVAQEHAEEREAAKEKTRAAREAEVPRPPSLPPRWDQSLDALKAAPTPAEAQRNRRSHVAPAMIALDRIDVDDTFQLRPEGDLSKLATDIARLGQLFPVDVRLRPPDRFQILCGFRRVAALRFLQRDKVLARLHTDLSDEDALHMALAEAIHAEPVSADQLRTLQERLASEKRLSAATRDMLDKALAEDDSLAPENVEEEVDAEELADDVTIRLGEINQDLSLLAEAFSQLDDHRKEQLLQQLGYSAELVAFLGGK
ncbi:MAG: ParB N-terminal domain-containing protein [Myxococcota bacterium]|nr:ParB N-terminal domain-containing protein [Myxococcota bacterium]